MIFFCLLIKISESPRTPVNVKYIHTHDATTHRFLHLYPIIHLLLWDSSSRYPPSHLPRNPSFLQSTPYPEFPAPYELYRGALEDRDRTVPLPIRKLDGAAARLIYPLALLNSHPEPRTLRGQERQPEGRRALKPELVSRALGYRRGTRGALSLPARFAPPIASFREAASTRARSRPVRASREPASAGGYFMPPSPPGGSRVSPPGAPRPCPAYVRHAHTHTPRPFNQTVPEAAAAAARSRQERGGGEGNRRVSPVLSLPRPPPLAGGGGRGQRGEKLAPGPGPRCAGRGSEREPPAGLDGANLDKGHFRLHVSPRQLSPAGSACRAAGRASVPRGPRRAGGKGTGGGCSSGAVAPPLPAPSLPPLPPLQRAPVINSRSRRRRLKPARCRSLTHPPPRSGLAPLSPRRRLGRRRRQLHAAPLARSPSPQPPAAGFTLPDRAPNAAAQSASPSLASAERRLDWMDADGAPRANQARRGAGRGAGARAPRAGGGGAEREGWGSSLFSRCWRGDRGVRASRSRRAPAAR